ncbi:MAG TPA: hypothetical protein VF228_12900 [Iamia sp.]
MQLLDVQSQVLVLSRLAQARATDGRFAPADVGVCFDALGIGRPPKLSNVLGRLEGRGLVSRLRSPGSWRLSPKGVAESQRLVTDLDLTGLEGEMAQSAQPAQPDIGRMGHPLIPPTFAPPGLIAPLGRFLADHPFDTNVFAMSRFPDGQDGADPDPVASAIDVAREVCDTHGLALHLASDRAMSDDLWSNVAAHMWASRYGIAFVEDRRQRGLNYNLTIEVGAMLVTGRRTALLKDVSIPSLPTDLVGHIYKDVDLDDDDQVAGAVHVWISADLGLGSCSRC